MLHMRKQIILLGVGSYPIARGGTHQCLFNTPWRMVTGFTGDRTQCCQPKNLPFLWKVRMLGRHCLCYDIWLLFKKLLEYSMKDKLYIQNNAWSFSSTKNSNWGPLNCGLFSPLFFSSIRLISIEYYLLVYLFIPHILFYSPG